MSLEIATVALEIATIITRDCHDCQKRVSKLSLEIVKIVIRDCQKCHLNCQKCYKGLSKLSLGIVNGVVRDCTVKLYLGIAFRSLEIICET